MQKRNNCDFTSMSRITLGCPELPKVTLPMAVIIQSLEKSIIFSWVFEIFTSGFYLKYQILTDLFCFDYIIVF